MITRSTSIAPPRSWAGTIWSAWKKFMAPVRWEAKTRRKSLGEKLKLPWLFAPVERRWWKDSFGNGALTSLPILHWQRIPLGGEEATSHRNLLLLRVQFSGQPLNVLITHLSRDADRPHELRSVISLFQSLQEPALLIGDLNSEPADPQISELRKTAGVARPHRRFSGR